MSFNRSTLSIPWREATQGELVLYTNPFQLVPTHRKTDLWKLSLAERDAADEERKKSECAARFFIPHVSTISLSQCWEEREKLVSSLQAALML